MNQYQSSTATENSHQIKWISSSKWMTRKTSDKVVFYTIPNKDVRSIFESYIDVYNRELINQYSKGVSKCLTDGNAEEAEELFNDFLLDSVCAGKYNVNFYIGLVKGILSNFQILTDSDDCFIAKNEDGAVGILIKASDNFRNLKEDANKACRELKERIDISGINAYGISFCHKECCIKKVNSAAYL